MCFPDLVSTEDETSSKIKCDVNFFLFLFFLNEYIYIGILYIFLAFLCTQVKREGFVFELRSSYHNM